MQLHAENIFSPLFSYFFTHHIFQSLLCNIYKAMLSFLVKISKHVFYFRWCFWVKSKKFLTWLSRRNLSRFRSHCSGKSQNVSPVLTFRYKWKKKFPFNLLISQLITCLTLLLLDVRWISKAVTSTKKTLQKFENEKNMITAHEVNISVICSIFANEDACWF